jgi:hypothetical protein
MKMRYGAIGMATSPEICHPIAPQRAFLFPCNVSHAGSQAENALSGRFSTTLIPSVLYDLPDLPCGNSVQTCA